MITGLLRGELGFRGLVMTDDLDMGAILNAGSFDDTLGLALAAGNDLLMICHRVELLERARSVLDTQPRPLLDAALERVGGFKAKMQPPADFSRSAFDAINREIWDLRVAVLGEERARMPAALPPSWLRWPAASGHRPFRRQPGISVGIAGFGGPA